MNSKKLTALVGLAVCTLALAALGSAKNPVTRPNKGIGHATIVVDQTFHAVITQWGEATHLGRWADSGEGEMAMDATTGSFYFGSANGTTVAANGDTINWEITQLTGPMSNNYTGGTGRFVGVTGGMTFTITSSNDPVFNEDGTMTLEFTYDMVGEATY